MLSSGAHVPLIIAVGLTTLLAAVAKGYVPKPVRLFGSEPRWPEYEKRTMFPYNTKWTEKEATFADDGTMVFCSGRQNTALAPGDVMDLYISHVDKDGSYAEPVNMGPIINSIPDTTGDKAANGDDREPWISPDGNTLYFRSTRLAKKSDPPVADPTTFAAFSAGPDTKMFVTHKVNGEWTKPEPLPAPLNTPGGREHCPMELRYGSALCFASLRKGGYGASDIYCAPKKSDGTFGEPVNAGPNVNSKGDEFHFNEDKNGFIHFSALGHPGNIGKADIWITRKDSKGGFIEAKNAGPVVNRGGVNICSAFTPTGDMTFFSKEPTEPGLIFDIYIAHNKNA